MSNIIEFAILSKMVFYIKTKFNWSITFLAELSMTPDFFFWSNLKTTNKRQYLTMYDKIVNSYHPQCFEFCVGVVEHYSSCLNVGFGLLWFHTTISSSKTNIICSWLSNDQVSRWHTLFAMYRHPKVSLWYPLINVLDYWLLNKRSMLETPNF